MAKKSLLQKGFIAVFLLLAIFLFVPKNNAEAEGDYKYLDKVGVWCGDIMLGKDRVCCHSSINKVGRGDISEAESLPCADLEGSLFSKLPCKWQGIEVKNPSQDSILYIYFPSESKKASITVCDGNWKSELMCDYSFSTWIAGAKHVEECKNGCVQTGSGLDTSAKCSESSISCTSDGCNNKCPTGCTVDQDPDCGCKNSDSCCGIGCTFVQDNDCAAGTSTQVKKCPPSLQGGLVPCGRSCDDPNTEINEATNCTLCHFFVLIKRIIDFLTTTIAFPLLVIMVLIAGILYLTSGANEERLRRAKDVLKAAGIGIVIVVCAWVMIDTLITILTPANSPFQSWAKITCPVEATSQSSSTQTSSSEKTSKTDGKTSKTESSSVTVDINDKIEDDELIVNVTVKNTTNEAKKYKAFLYDAKDNLIDEEPDFSWEGAAAGATATFSVSTDWDPRWDIDDLREAGDKYKIVIKEEKEGVVKSVTRNIPGGEKKEGSEKEKNNAESTPNEEETTSKVGE